MKKFYVLLAVAAMLASCAETDLVNEVNAVVEPQAIGFETFAGKTTRTATESENSNTSYEWALNDHHESFYVWGYKSVADAYVFDGKKVSYSSEYSKWGYTGLVYWDKAASSYEFYAAAPATPNIWTLNKNSNDQNDDHFTTSEFTINAHNATASDHKYKQSFKGTTNAVDLMIADPENVQKGQFGNQVQLEFIHILSRLNITVSKGSDLAAQTVTLKSLTINNVKNVGTFNENATLTDPATLKTGTEERWTKTGAKTNYNALKDEVLIEVPTTGDPEYMLQALIMPQIAKVEEVKLDGTSTGLKDPYFTIVYTITDADNTEQFSASYNLATAFTMLSPKNIAFNEGWQNTLNIVIEPTKIAFTGQVAMWGVGSGSLEID